jgi:hypothetical protein
MRASHHDRHRAAAMADDRPLRRFWPERGTQLTLDVIRGPWRPTGAVAGVGVFAVRWETRAVSFWAPLHDFAPADQLRLIEACRWVDQTGGTTR